MQALDTCFTATNSLHTKHCKQSPLLTHNANAAVITVLAATKQNTEPTQNVLVNSAHVLKTMYLF